VRRRIKKARAQFISLVPRGANGLTCLYKSADSTVTFGPLSKFDEERGEMLAVVYAPEVRDSQGDIASADVIKEMAYASAREGVELDIRHDNKPVGKERAFIAEKFIVQKGDQRFAGWKDYQGRAVDVTGGWAIVAKIDDPALRKLYKDGGWNGVSLQGPAEVEIEKSGEEIPPPPPPEETNMLTIEDLKKELDARDAKLVDLITKSKTDVKKDDKVDFDPLNIQHVEQRLAALERERLSKSVDMNDADALRAHRDSLKKGNLISETAAEKVARLEKEAADLKAKLAKAEKASAIPPSKSAEDATQVIEDGLSKEDRDAVNEGKAMAALMNKQRGYVTK
jgi:hypothetical protein